MGISHDPAPIVWDKAGKFASPIKVGCWIHVVSGVGQIFEVLIMIVRARRY